MRFWKIAAWMVVFAAPPALAGEQASIDVAGKPRSYYIHVPADLPPGAPVVFMLHGAGGTGKHAAETYGWNAKADRARFIVVAPDAVAVFADREANFATNPRVWNDGSGRAGPNVNGSDDIGLIRALIAGLQAKYAIDRTRIYVSGFSSGSSMTQRIGLEMVGEIAAIALVAGELWQKGGQRPRAIPVLYILGDQDPLSPYEGGEARQPWGGPPQIREAAKLQPAYWARIDGCANPPEERRIAATVRLTAWTRCRNGAEVFFYTIEGQGHHWPGATPSANYVRIAGPYVESFKAAELIWDFFSRFRLN